jgi:predicted nicotinamide N-methyase
MLPCVESFVDRARFIRAQTVLIEVPFVPEIRLYTATDLAPIWRATQERLSDLGVDVPFWCVPWAGGQALARWVLDHPEAVRGLRVVDFGTGSGLVAIACACAGARSVRAFDTDPLAAVACALNAEANEVAVDVLCVDVVGRDALELDADVVFAGDIWYERAPSQAFGPWLAQLARSGARVVTGDPSRSYAPSNLIELARYDVLTYADLEATPVCLTRVLELPRTRES